MMHSRSAKKPATSAKKAQPNTPQSPEAELPADGGIRLALPGFEGPLDLLLHLIQEHELDILNIPIAFVTKKYLEHIELMQLLNIDIASEYLVMAATLAHIKSRMLLPTPPADQDESEEEELDPRAELIKRLLEYQKYKKAAEELASRSVLGRDIFVRGPQPAPDPSTAPLAPVGSFKLLEAFQRILARSKIVIDHQVEFERFSISDRINQLVDLLKGKGRILFDELFDGQMSRPDLIVTFLALLELTRLRVIRVFQEGSLEPISLEFVEEGSDGMDTSELDRPSEEVRPKKAPEPEPERLPILEEPEPDPAEDEEGEFDVAAILAEAAAEALALKQASAASQEPEEAPTPAAADAAPQEEPQHEEPVTAVSEEPEEASREETLNAELSADGEPMSESALGESVRSDDDNGPRSSEPRRV